MELDFSNMIEEKDGKIIHTNLQTSAMSIKEAIQQKHQLHGKIKELEKKIGDLKKQIEEDVFAKNLAEMEKNYTKLVEFEKSWTEIIAPAVENLRKKIQQAAKERAAKVGYKRMTEPNQKIVAENQIMAEICAEHELDRNHPIIMEARREAFKK